MLQRKLRSRELVIHGNARLIFHGTFAFAVLELGFGATQQEACRAHQKYRTHHRHFELYMFIVAVVQGYGCASNSKANVRHGWCQKKKLIKNSVWSNLIAKEDQGGSSLKQQR